MSKNTTKSNKTNIKKRKAEDLESEKEESKEIERKELYRRKYPTDNASPTSNASTNFNASTDNIYIGNNMLTRSASSSGPAQVPTVSMNEREFSVDGEDLDDNDDNVEMDSISSDLVSVDPSLDYGLSAEQFDLMQRLLERRIKEAVQDERSKITLDNSSKFRDKNSMNFNVDHVYLTLEGIKGADCRRLWGRWYTMVITGNMSVGDRNDSLDEELKETLTLICPTYSILENKRVSREEPLSIIWQDYDHEDLARLMKYYFKDIDTKLGSSKKAGYEDLLSNIGERLTNKVLKWTNTSSFQEISDEIVQIQITIKDLHLIPSDHADLIGRIFKTMNNRVTDSRTGGSVQLLNNLNNFLLRKKTLANRNHEDSFSTDIFRFLKIIMEWTGIIVQGHDDANKLGLSATPIQQNSHGHTLNTNKFSNEKKNVSSTSTRPVQKSDFKDSKIEKGFFHLNKDKYDLENLCKGCGRAHLKGYTGCDILSHPDVNRSSSSWLESEKGKLYSALGLTRIDTFKRLDENGKKLVRYDFRNSKGINDFHNAKGISNVHLINLSNKSPNSSLPIFSFKDLKGNDMVNFKTLIDTGAVDASFISVGAARKLVDAGYEMFDCKSKVDMGVMDLSQPIIGKFKNLEVYFFNFVTNKKESFILNEIFIINSLHELIIGRIPICKIDLFNKLKQDICRDCCNDRHSTLSQNKVLSNITSNSIERDKIIPQYTDQYMNNLYSSINPEWVEANRLCNLTRLDNFQVGEEDHFQEEKSEGYPSNQEINSVKELNNIKHTGTINGQRADIVIKGLDNVKPGQRIPLSDLFTTESDGMNPEDLADMDTIDQLVEEAISLVGKEKPNLKENSAGARVSKILTNLKISDPKDEKDFINSIKFSGPEKLQEDLKKLCMEYADIFSSALSTEPARVKPLKIDIDKSKWEDPKNCYRSRLLTPEKEAVMKEQILARLGLGVLTKSEAEYWSQVHMVPKGDGRWRMTIDFRRLNDTIKTKNWPLPQIDILIQEIGKHRPKYLGVLDMVDGYFQMSVHVDSRVFTAFIAKGKLYEWTRVPQGLKSASAHFQRAMETEVLEGLIGDILQVFLDDICIFATTEEEFVENCRKAFERFRTFNIKLSPKKVRLGSSEEILLGHTINENGWSFHRDKLMGVNDFVRPTTSKQLHTFIGLCNYFRSHVRDASEKMRPLYDLLKLFKGQKNLFWTPAAVAHFDALKKAIFEIPTLFFVDPNAEVFVQTDASDYGISGYIFQRVEDKEVIIAFFSQALHNAELRWSIFEKEAFAIFRSLKRFEYLLTGITFVLRTDHRNLIYMNEHASQKVYAWKMWIQKFNCIIEHVPGHLNVITDGGSRLAAPLNFNNITSLNNMDVEGNECEGMDESSSFTGNNLTEILGEYNDNYGRGESLSYLFSNMHVDSESESPYSLSALSRGTMPIKISRRGTKMKFLDDERYNLIEKFHNTTIGHGGKERTIRLIKERSGLKDFSLLDRDVAFFIKYCSLCQMMRVQNLKTKILPFNVSVNGPMDRLCMDLIGPLEPSCGGNKYIMVILDTFSRFIQLHGVADTGIVEARKIIVRHIGTFGSPIEILSDNATEFNSKLCDEIMKFTGIYHLKIMPYSHQENSLCERANKEVVKFLRTIIYDKFIAKDWEEYLPLVTRIYNSSFNKSIGVSPSSIIFGNSIDLDRGLVFPHSELKEQTMSEYMENMLIAQRIIIEKTLQNQMETNHSNSEKRLEKMKGLPTVTFAKDSYVTASYHDDKIPTKLALPRRGPFRVLDHEDGKVHVQNLVTLQEEWIHASLCNQFLYDPKRVDPVGIARKALPNPEYVIEKILDHVPKDFNYRTKKGELFFLIQWEGFSAEHNSWEPWENLRKVGLVHDYLRKNDMKFVIPKRFKD